MELAGDDARDVEEIFDERGLGARVALDALVRPRGRGGVGGRDPQDLNPAEDGVERRAQLVRERGQELVLEPAGGAQLLVAPLDLGDHAVEGIDELPDLVLALLGGADV